MSVLDGPGEGTWSVFALKVVEQREELLHKLAGQAAHIKSLEGLLVDALRERDALHGAMTVRYSLRREIEEIFGVTGAEASDEQLALGVAAARRIVRERDEARRDLGEILAVIHRDGGHHTGEFGVSQSVADAHATWAAVVRERDEALSDAERWRNAHHEACVRLQAHDCGEEFAILGADAERWRNAHDVMRETVKKLLLSRDASWTGGNDWPEAVDDAIHALGMEPDDDA
jgi:hypothetical protein